MMVGRNVDMTYPRQFAQSPGKVLLEVKGLSARTGITDIDLDRARGRDRRALRSGRLGPQRGGARDLRRRPRDRRRDPVRRPGDDPAGPTKRRGSALH